jgi:hypothetical protein
VGRRIAKLSEALKGPATQQFLLTCGLRGLESVADEVLDEMPITIKYDVRKSPWYQRGRQEGMKETLRLALKKRFGRIPAAVTKRVDAMTNEQTQEMILAILDAKSLKDLFGSSPH